MAVSVRLNPAAIRAFLDDPTGAVARDIRRRAARVEAEQRRLVPVRTGHLRSTIFTRSAGRSAEIGASADYALYVEYGTSDTPREPFIRPSLRAAR